MSPKRPTTAPRKQSTADPRQALDEFTEKHAPPPEDAPEPPPGTTYVDVPSGMVHVVQEAASLLQEAEQGPQPSSDDN